MAADDFRLVVVGGGIAGLELATRLGHRRGVHTTLVDHALSHTWKPMLHRFAAGTARPDREKIDFLAHAGRHGYRFHPGRLVGIDRLRRRIEVRPLGGGDPEPAPHGIRYDLLVLAIGSRANDFGTPGVAANCRCIDDLTEAERFRESLRDALLRAEASGGPVSVAIVGGGATGVELAAELKRAMNLAAGFGATSASRLRLSLLESGDRLLATMPREVSDGAARSLRGLGVDIRLGAKVTAADARGYALDGGERIDATLLVWAAGVRAPAVLDGFEGLERDRAGRLAVRPDLRTTRDEAIVALGDCAHQADPDAGGAVPATAQAARQQALHLARGFGAWMRTGRARPFRYHDRGQVVTLADFNGWGTLGGVVFGAGRLRGLSARAAHALLYRQHQFELLGVPRGLATWFADGVEAALDPGVRLG